MKRLNYNYHTHTYLCGHATGTPEEYVKRAIEGGIKHMGFSDHFPIKFSDGFESGFRVPVAQVKEYYNKIVELKEKYKDKIDIKIGFEMEYYPELFDEMVQSAKSYGAEYLILGPHYFQPENIIGTTHSSSETDDSERLKKIAQNIVDGIKTGVFTCVAHPDMVHFTGDETIYQNEMRIIARASKEYNIPLEMNLYGIRDNRHYPNELFWEVCGEENCPMTMGFDSHDALSAYDEESIVKAKNLIEKYKLNYIGKPDVILL